MTFKRVAIVTARVHIKNIFVKFNVHDRMAALAEALRRGFVHLLNACRHIRETVMNLMNRRAMRRLLTVTACVALMGAGCGRTDEAAVPARQAAAVHVRMTDIQQVVAEVVEAMQQDPALAVIDQPFRVVDANGYNVGVAMIRRTRPETESLLHEQVTEVYYILDGAGR